MAELLNLFFTLIYLTILARIILTLVLSFMANDPPPALVSVTQVLIQVTDPGAHPPGAALVKSLRCLSR